MIFELFITSDSIRIDECKTFLNKQPKSINDIRILCYKFNPKNNKNLPHDEVTITRDNTVTWSNLSKTSEFGDTSMTA